MDLQIIIIDSHFILLIYVVYTFQVLCVILAAAWAEPTPGKIPKIYNALITSNQNLEPSKAYPVYQPVLHNAFPFPYQPVFYGDIPLTNVSMSNLEWTALIYPFIHPTWLNIWMITCLISRVIINRLKLLPPKKWKAQRYKGRYRG